MTESESSFRVDGIMESVVEIHVQPREGTWYWPYRVTVDGTELLADDDVTMQNGGTPRQFAGLVAGFLGDDGERGAPGWAESIREFLVAHYAALLAFEANVGHDTNGSQKPGVLPL